MTEQNENPFEGAEIIAVYTAEEAVADGILLHFSPATALEAGYRLTVLLTRDTVSSMKRFAVSIILAQA